MSKTMVQVKRSQAVKLFESFEFATAQKWGPKQLLDRLLTINTLVDDDTPEREDAELQETLQTVLTAIDDGSEITVEDDTVAAAPVKKEKKAKETTDENGDAAAEAKPAKKEKPPKAEKQPKAEKTGPAGVRASTTTISYQAGVVLKKHGLDGGITEEMVDELTKILAPKSNPDANRASLAWAWHVVRGYLGME